MIKKATAQIKFRSNDIVRFCNGYPVKCEGKYYLIMDDCELTTDSIAFVPAINGLVEVIPESIKYEK